MNKLCRNLVAVLGLFDLGMAVGEVLFRIECGDSMGGRVSPPFARPPECAMHEGAFPNELWIFVNVATLFVLLLMWLFFSAPAQASDVLPTSAQGNEGDPEDLP